MKTMSRWDRWNYRSKNWSIRTISRIFRVS